MNCKFLNSLTLLGTLALASACAKAPPPRDAAADLKAMKAYALGWFDEMAKGDVDAATARYAEDALVMPPGLPAVTGRAAIKTLLAGQVEGLKAGGLAIKDRGETGSGVSGDIGWISGRYEVVDASGTAVDSGSYLSIHRREGDQWPYIRDTWNSDRAPAPAPESTPASAPASAPVKK